MEINGCPYLGLPDDKRSDLALPSEGNFCFKAFPVAPVKREHQSSTCLTGQHAVCPVFLARRAAPLPRELAPPPTAVQRTRKVLGETSLLVAVVLLYLASIWFGASRVSARVISLSNPASYAWLSLPGSPVQSDALPEPFSTRLAPTATPFSNSQDVPQVAKDCPLPQDWEPYIVQPSDSIFRISILFGISEDALQKANCMAGQAKLTPGSTLYVPVLNPTAVPTATRRPLAAPLPVVISETDDDDRPRPMPVVEVPVVVPDNPQVVEENPVSTPAPESPKDQDEKDTKADDEVKVEKDVDDKDDDDDKKGRKDDKDDDKKDKDNKDDKDD